MTDSPPDQLTAHPVPLEQQPCQEYEELKRSGFFRWGAAAQPDYLWGLGRGWLAGWLITGPLAASSFPVERDPIHFVLVAGGGSALFLALGLLRLYLGWSYVGRRLNSATVVYEESGWHDGDVWLKPPAEQDRERLVAKYQVEPVLRRVRRTALALSGGLGFVTLSWYGLNWLG